MDEIDKPVLVYTTCPSQEAAESIGGALVEAGLAACVNILPGMVSIYVWQGDRQRDEEVVMIAKTRTAMAKAVTSKIEELHPYDVPAVLVLPVSGGAARFMAWIGEQTADD